MWGPVGYEAVQYYYLPDIECYYYVPRHQFVYLSGPNWVFSYNLPSRCRGYDLYSGYKVVCNEPRPYMNYYHDREVYARYRGCHGRQPVIRDYRGHGGGYYGHGGDYGHGGGYYVEQEHPGNAYGHYKHGWGGGGHGHGHGHGR